MFIYLSIYTASACTILAGREFHRTILLGWVQMSSIVVICNPSSGPALDHLDIVGVVVVCVGGGWQWWLVMMVVGGGDDVMVGGCGGGSENCRHPSSHFSDGRTDGRTDRQTD
ncbi:hypothetical protein DPMN_043692 [Dreissena polymorpha]|uniref:Uncharacterized protein n=1 Tax=Dreissena polymorpha TaxID=45954 RepID=A0A9D4D0Y9_DREPO|nr:hypothetical protein DPMN_043692 [Dreissena polymorpha]